MANFAKGLAQGLSGGLNQSFDTLSNAILKKAELEYSKNQNELQRQQDLQDYEERERIKRKLETEQLKKEIESLSRFIQGGAQKSELIQVPNYTFKQPDTKLKLGERNIDQPFQLKPIDNIPQQLPSKLQQIMSFSKDPVEERIRYGLEGKMSPKEIMNIISPEVEYKDIKERLHQRIGINPKTGQTEIIQDYQEETNPLWTPKYEKRIINPMGTFDKATNKIRYDYGNYDSESGQWEMDDKNNKMINNVHFENRTVEGTNGEILINPKVQKGWDQTAQSLFKLKSMHDTLTKGQVPYEHGKPLTYEGVDVFGKKTQVPMTIEKLEERLKTESDTYLNGIYSSAPEDYLKFEEKLISDAKKGSSEGYVEPDIFWKELYDQYKTKQISEESYHTGYNIFRGTYYFDPLIKYGIPTEDKK